LTSEHSAIIDALAARDTEKATFAVETHINSSINGLESAGQMPEDYLSL